MTAQPLKKTEISTAQILTSGALVVASAMSALAAKHGERIVALDAEFLSPDAIASEINAGLGRNDRINTLQVNKVLLEMQRLGKAGAR